MAEERTITTEGIILKKHPVGENDFIVTLYSPVLGKVQAAAKGARKINGSLSGHIESLNLCLFQLYKSPARHTITQCQVKENFRRIRDDFDRTITAGMIIEIFHKSTMSSEHAQELFQLLAESLHKLNNSQQHFLTVESFKLNLLNRIGVLPNLEQCASCHNRWQNTDSIWLETNGHLQCHPCKEQHHHGEKTPGTMKQIEFSIMKLIHYLSRPIKDQTLQITLREEQKEQLRHITGFFLQHFLDREILSEKIFQNF